ncbi:hypothetical protein BC781_10935 [Sediminitomix flava]|uniref:Uncharacterized protein n=1 Tax=Sediminitomix flava TaxID=379075 RepID=A0A315Z0K0_SEDFL|nr:hypothetical protein BC781_10935 [Sediminitomix flava]
MNDTYEILSLKKYFSFVSRQKNNTTLNTIYYVEELLKNYGTPPTQT